LGKKTKEMKDSTQWAYKTTEKSSKNKCQENKNKSYYKYGAYAVRIEQCN
jgi:hypothetical protein